MENKERYGIAIPFSAMGGGGGGIAQRASTGGWEGWW